MELPSWAKMATNCRYGDFAYPARDAYVGRSLDYYGEWCQDEILMLLQLVDSDSRVIEVGGNIGADSVPLAKVVRELHVMEPQTQIYELLHRNLSAAVQDPDHFWCAYHMAIGSRDAYASLPTLNYHAENNYGGVSVLAEREDIGSDGVGTYEVKMNTLDALFYGAHRWDRLDLIKADVEGYELMVLEGGNRLIQEYRPALYLENNGGALSPDLIRYVRRLGYNLWWHTPPLFNPDNWRKRTDDLWPGIVSCNMLCLPPGHPKTHLTTRLKAVGTPTERPLAAVGHRVRLL